MGKHNPVVWFEIYVNDLDRAVSFYENVLLIRFEDKSDLSNDTIQMKRFPGDMENYGAGGALAKVDDIEPSSGGSIIYFGCEDCKEPESRVEPNGGKILQPKMSIGKNGFISIIMDSEGNSIGFHSLK